MPAICFNHSFYPTFHTLYKTIEKSLGYSIPGFLKCFPKSVPDILLTCNFRKLRVHLKNHLFQFLPDVFNRIQVWRVWWPVTYRYTHFQEPITNLVCSMNRGTIV